MIANKNNFHHRNLGGDSTEMRLIYYTTHARATPWLIGLLFGYFLHHQNVRKTRLPKWLALVLWILSLSMLATVIFAVYPYTQSGAGDISAMAGAFYLCCSRIAWPLALCWIIWACQNGLAPIVNEFLSWSFWQPLSKLSYCLYIWHLLVETVHIARIKTSLLPCLNGIRCLTIIWIILGHGYMYLLLAPTINAYDIVAWAQMPFSMILQSGTTSVDTFFLLSGLLLVLSALREMDR